MSQTTGFLTGKTIVASPSTQEPPFHQSVIFLCGHDAKGAMGLIINKPLANLTFSELLQNLKIDHCEDTPPETLYFGGPVDIGRGFVLHSSDYSHDSSLKILPEVSLSATADILSHMVCGQPPQKSLIAMGYTGWDAGQLDQEILENGWIVVDTDISLLFHRENRRKWSRTLKNSGINPDMLSLEGGNA